MSTIRVLLIFAVVAASGRSADTRLFKGKDLSGFDTFLRDKGSTTIPTRSSGFTTA